MLHVHTHVALNESSCPQVSHVCACMQSCMHAPSHARSCNVCKRETSGGPGLVRLDLAAEALLPYPYTRIFHVQSRPVPLIAEQANTHALLSPSSTHAPHLGFHMLATSIGRPNESIHNVFANSYMHAVRRLISCACA